MSVRQAPGTWSLRVAASERWNGGVDASPSYPCCWKASIGGVRCARQSRSWRSEFLYILRTDFYARDTIRVFALMAYCARGCRAGNSS